MKFGFVFPGGEARQAAELARVAEQAGWDGFFVPDALWWHDPWVTLSAAAMLTERIRLGTMITPVSRRRPWTLAAQTATLDRLSNGRVILSVGLGATDTGFAQFGEVTDRKLRAELLDEGLEVMAALWRGEPLTHDGKHYHIRPVEGFPPPPPPVQSPRIPIWVVGGWPSERSMRRVLRWDGWLPNKLNPDGKHGTLTPEDVRAMKAYTAERRSADQPLDIIVEGQSDGAQARMAAEEVQRWAEAGATWWLESAWNAPVNLENIRKRIAQGPPHFA